MSSLPQSLATASARANSAQREIMRFDIGEKIDYSFVTKEVAAGLEPNNTEATFRVTNIDRPKLQVTVALSGVAVEIPGVAVQIPGVVEGVAAPSRLNGKTQFVFVPTMSEGVWENRDRNIGSEPFLLWLGPNGKSLYHCPTAEV